MDYVYVLVGLVLLFAGGEGLVRGSIALAERLGLSKLLIGILVVGFGTSAPELLVCVQAALAGQPEVAVGNVVGSNIANILLIAGVAAALAPLRAEGGSIQRDTLVMVAATALMWLVAGWGVAGRLVGALMLTCLAAYLLYAYRVERCASKHAIHEVAGQEGEISRLPMVYASLTLLGGLVMLVVGADLLVRGAVAIATGMGIPQAVIGLTLVAVGTSLPELATALVAAMKKQTEVVLGNVIGSNIFNILGILGVTAMVRPVPVAPQFAWQDIPLAALVAVVLTLVLAVYRGIPRGLGVVFVLGYVVYMVALFASGAV